MYIDKEVRALVVEKMREIHYWAGLTLNAAQGLEYGCKLLLYILAEQKLINYSIQDASALMEGDLKKIFGQVCNVLKKFIQFDEQQQEMVLQAIERRNWFIHEFYVTKAETLVDDQGRNECVRELKALRKQFTKTDAIIKPTIHQLMKLFYNKDIDDFSKEAIDQITSQQKTQGKKSSLIIGNF